MEANHNTADEVQVKKQDKKETNTRFKEIEDMKYLLSLPQFRRFAWRFLAHCRVMSVPQDNNNSYQSFLIGRMDVGHFLYAELCQADRKAVFKMTEEENPDVK